MKPQLWLAPAVARSAALGLALLALAFSLACGSSSTTPSVGCPGATGSFTNASLAAGSQWTYELSGFQAFNGANYVPYSEAGVFTVDGNGNITSGTDDFYASTFTGTYKISSNGTGTLNANLATGVSLLWGITLSDSTPGALYIIEADAAANSSGNAYQQMATAFTAVPSGTFVFRTHVTAPSSTVVGSMAAVGVMNVSGGAITSLHEDVLPGGQLPSQRTATGTFSSPNSTTGVGSVTFTDSQALVSTYNYYVIDGSSFLLFETDSNFGFGLGRAELQTGVPFTNASLAAGSGFAFGSRGDSSISFADGVNSVGAFTVDGTGTVTSGSYDSERDGTPTLGLTLTGTYNADASGDGRYTFSLNAAATALTQTAYMINPQRGFFLVAGDATRVEDGSLDRESSTSFTNGNLNGQFAFVMGGFTSSNLINRTGTVSADGNGTLGWAEVVNATGIITTPGCLTGTYAVGANGRVSGTVNTLSNTLVFYLVSPSAAYMMQGDAGIEIFGGMNLQTSTVADPPGNF
jgi:hypothetical protein